MIYGQNKIMTSISFSPLSWFESFAKTMKISCSVKSEEGRIYFVSDTKSFPALCKIISLFCQLNWNLFSKRRCLKILKDSHTIVLKVSSKLSTFLAKTKVEEYSKQYFVNKSVAKTEAESKIGDPKSQFVEIEIKGIYHTIVHAVAKGYKLSDVSRAESSKVHTELLQNLQHIEWEPENDFFILVSSGSSICMSYLTRQEMYELHVACAIYLKSLTFINSKL